MQVATPTVPGAPLAQVQPGLSPRLHTWTLIGVLCLGYPQDPSDIPELERRGWQAREPLADRLFER